MFKGGVLSIFDWLKFYDVLTREQVVSCSNFFWILTDSTQQFCKFYKQLILNFFLRFADMQILSFTIRLLAYFTTRKRLISFTTKKILIL